MQKPVQQYLSNKYDSQVLQDIMTPEYQREYAEHMASYLAADLNEFDKDDVEDFRESLDKRTKQKFDARHAVRTEFGANKDFIGNGLTKSREGSSQYGVVETLTLENNPPPISKMKNIKTVSLKPR